MGVPYTFGTATTSIPLSQLDANFNTPVTLGNTTVGLGNTVTTVGNLTLTNVNITSGTINSAVVVESYALANAVVYSDASKDGTTSANLTFNGTTFTAVNDASISGLTVGKGGGAVSTNVALGQSALAGNSTGLRVTAVGNQALLNNTASENTALGARAMLTNTSGANNTAVGRDSMYFNTTGAENSALGLNSLISNTTGSYNTAIGRDALQANTTASNNTAVGYQAAYSNTTGADNTAVGRLSLNANTTGARNVAMGNSAMVYNTTGSNNVGLGTEALANNTTASSNTAIGYLAGYSTTTGEQNAYVGRSAGQGITTGTEVTAVGYSAMGNCGGGANYNTAVGRASLNFVTGTLNTAIGHSSGNAITSGSKNTIIGAYTGNNGGLDIRTLSNRIVISDGDGNPRIYVNDGGEVIVGGVTDQGAYNLQCNGTAVWGAGAYVNGSDARIKENITPLDSGLDVIAKLNPVTYKYKETWSKDQSIQTGFIAQELLEALKDKTYVDGVVQQNSDYMSVAYQNIIPILVKAMQELKQEFDDYKASHP